MSIEDQLQWVPSRARYAILYCQDDESWFSLKQPEGDLFVTRVVPSLTRGEGKEQVWGQQAALWRHREPGSTPVFAQNIPVEARLAAQFLRWFREQFWDSKAPKKLFVTRPEGARWGDELWTQTLDSTPFQLGGFITPLQRALVLQRREWEENEHHRVLWLQIEPEGLRWAATGLEGEPLTGWDPRLSLRLLTNQLNDYARKQTHLELGVVDVRHLLAGATGWQGEISIQGRQVGSGLPARRTLDLARFWAERTGFSEQSRQVLATILDQLQGSPIGSDHFREQVHGRGYTLLLDGPAWPLLMQLRLARAVH